MDKEKLVNNLIYLLLGVIFASIFKPNTQFQAFLYQYIPSQWGYVMGLIILCVVFVVLIVWSYRLEKKLRDKQHNEAKQLIKDTVKETINELNTSHKAKEGVEEQHLE